MATFLQSHTLLILAPGVVAFGVSTAAGVLIAKLMNLVRRGRPINPLIGSASVIGTAVVAPYFIARLSG